MQILAANNKFVLASNKSQTFLLDSQDFKIVATKETYSKYGSLQYGTGIAALTSGSVVLIYDFKYQRQLYTLQTYKKIFNICIRKNILIVVSQNRILLHNLQSKNNECFIETINGTIAFFNDDYYKLSIFYPQSNYTLKNKLIWSKKQNQIQGGIKYQMGCYFCFNKTNLVVLTLQNVLSMYEEHDLVKVYGYDSKVIGICSNQDCVFVVLTTGDVIGQNLRTQFSYEFQNVQDCELQAIAIEPLQTKIFLIGQYLYLWFQGKLKRAKFNQRKQILSKQQQAKNQKLRLQQIEQQKIRSQQILLRQKEQEELKERQEMNKQIQLLKQLELQREISQKTQQNNKEFISNSTKIQTVGQLYREYDQYAENQILQQVLQIQSLPSYKSKDQSSVLSENLNKQTQKQQRKSGSFLQKQE